MNHSIKQAQSHGIIVETQIVVPKELPYRETALCSLLSNLMDNAIEGTANTDNEEPIINVRIWPQQDYLFMRISNPIDNTISVGKRLSLETTKKNQQLHGYGTKIIRGIVEQYQGSVKFDVKDNHFIVEMMLYLEGEVQNGEVIYSNM